jgi:hypothetical protein
MSESTLLATIPRSDTEELHICINEYKLKKYVDIRIFYRTEEDENWNPTKKGITIPPAKINDIIAALRDAQKKLQPQEVEDWAQ